MDASIGQLQHALDTHLMAAHTITKAVVPGMKVCERFWLQPIAIPSQSSHISQRYKRRFTIKGGWCKSILLFRLQVFNGMPL